MVKKQVVLSAVIALILLLVGVVDYVIDDYHNLLEEQRLKAQKQLEYASNKMVERCFDKNKIGNFTFVTDSEGWNGQCGIYAPIKKDNQTCFLTYGEQINITDTIKFIDDAYETNPQNQKLLCGLSLTNLHLIRWSLLILAVLLSVVNIYWLMKEKTRRK